MYFDFFSVSYLLVSNFTDIKIDYPVSLGCINTCRNILKKHNYAAVTSPELVSAALKKLHGFLATLQTCSSGLLPFVCHIFILILIAFSKLYIYIRSNELLK